MELVFGNISLRGDHRVRENNIVQTITSYMAAGLNKIIKVLDK